ncbi:MAG: tetratricopeptide repeat protein [Bacteroidota bacterium]
MATKTELDELLKQAAALFEQKQSKELIALLSDKVLELYTSAELCALRAAAHDRLNEPEDALLYASMAMKIDPSHVDSHRVAGNAWSDKGDYDRAIVEYNKAIELDPNSSVIYYNRAISYDDKEDYDRAIADYSKAIELKSDFVDAFTNRGICYAKKRDYGLAIADFSKAIELEPEAEAYYNRGNTYIDSADYDLAISDFNKAIELTPGYVRAYNNRGVAFRKKKAYEAAIANFKKAIELEPNDALFQRNLGDTLFALGKYTEALAAYESAVKLKPKSAFYQSLRDKVKAKLGEAVTPSSTTLASPDNTANTASYIEQLLFGLDERDKKQIRMAWVDVDEVIDRIRKLLVYSGKEAVVHYTRLKVADIIAMRPESNLRYSNVVFMNDPEEGSVFLEHLADDELVKAFERGDNRDDNNIYLGSFLPEDKSDYLIMWRTYGKNEQNDEATGCSFLVNSGFFDREGGSLYAEAGKTGPLKQEETKDTLHSQPLYKVVYYDREIKQLVKDGYDLTKLTTEIENFKDRLRVLLRLRISDAPDNLEPKNGVIDGLVYRFISELRYFFKSAEYQFEKELRIIKYYPIEDPRVISDKDGIEVPRKLYIESTKKVQPFLSEIILGPKVVHPERYMYLEAQLRKHGHSTRVRKSDLSYQ